MSNARTASWPLLKWRTHNERMTTNTVADLSHEIGTSDRDIAQAPLQPSWMETWAFPVYSGLSEIV